MTLTIEDQLWSLYPDCEIVETTDHDNYKGWSKFFRYFEMRVRGGPFAGKVYSQRIPRPGYEHLAFDTRPLSEIEFDSHFESIKMLA